MLNLTENAAVHIIKYLQKRGEGIGIRLGVKASGCSGMSYTLEYVDNIDNNDLIFENFGVKLFIDPKSMIYLNGTKLDYIKEGLQEGFKFINPNVKDECGCGESFHI